MGRMVDPWLFKRSHTAITNAEAQLKLIMLLMKNCEEDVREVDCMSHTVEEEDATSIRLNPGFGI